MTASRQVRIPVFRGFGRQIGQGFGALAKVLGRRTAFPHLGKYVVPATESRGAGLLEFAVPKNTDNVSGRKVFEITARRLGRQTLKENVGSRSGKRKAPIGIKQTIRVSPTESAKQTSPSRRNFSLKISD